MGHGRRAKTASADGSLRYRVWASIGKTCDRCSRVVAGIRLIVTLGLEDRVFAHAFPDRFLELRGLEQRRAIRNTGDSLIRLKDPPGHAHINFFTGLEVEAKTSQHDCDQAAGAGAGNQVKVVAGLGYLVATRRLAFAFDIGSIHEFLEDNEHGVTANTTSICLVVSTCISDVSGMETERDCAYLETESVMVDPWWCPCGAD